MPASYPTSIKSFTTKSANDVIQPGHVNDVQDEIVALETQLLTTGTWTITLASSGGGAPTYTDQAGFYRKKGNEVTVSGILTLLTTGTLGAGTLTITGLPFTSQNATGNYASVCIPYWANLTATVVMLGGFIAPNTAVITLTKATAAAASTTTLNVADLANTTQIVFTATYQAA